MTNTVEQIANNIVSSDVIICASYMISELAERFDDALCDVLYGYDDEDEPIEYLEHWIVSEHLADKLIAKDEAVIKGFMGFNIWGRTCSGQAISMDSVFLEIASDLAD